MANKDELENKSSIGSDAVKLTVSKIISLGISTITAMLLSRFRTLEEYGTYSQMLLVVNLFTSIFMLGLPNSINYFLARAEAREEKKRFLSIYYTLSTFLSLIMGVTLVCAVPLIEKYFNNPNIRGFLYFLAIYPWASVISSSVENVLIVFHKTKWLMVYRLLNSISLLGAVLIVQWKQGTFAEYMSVYLLVYVIFAVVVYFVVSYLTGGLRVLLDKVQVRNIFVFSIPIGLAGILGTVNIEIDKLLVGWLMNTEELAIYTNASKELPVTIIATSITSVLLPKIVNLIKHNKNQEAVQLWGYATELSYIVICLIVAGVFAYADDVLTLLYSEKYISGLPVFRVYTLVLLLRCTYFGMILNAYGKSRMIFYSSILSLLLNCLLNPLLFWFLGIAGPAIATFLAMLIVTIMQLKLTSRYLGMNVKNIFPWNKIGFISLLNVTLACAFWILKNTIEMEKYTGEILESIFLGLIWAGIYFLVMKKEIAYLWSKLNNT